LWLELTVLLPLYQPVTGQSRSSNSSGHWQVVQPQLQSVPTKICHPFNKSGVLSNRQNVTSGFINTTNIH
jgi:hypothetical protein